MQGFIELLFYSILAGIVGTMIGAFISILFGKRSDRLTAMLMCFAGGVMLAVVCFDLIPEAIVSTAEVIGANNLFLQLIFVTFCVGIGVFFVMGLSYVSQLKYKNNAAEISTDVNVMKNRKMVQTGIILTLAIALHNFPEGLAIGASQSLSATKGLLMAIMIAIHNIPEGIAMVTPLKVGGMKKGKILILAALTGVPTVVGAIIGFLLGNTTLLLNAGCVAMAGGAMLYIIFSEMLKEAFELDKSKMPAIVTVASLVLGLIFIKVIM